ncbi:MAG: hypothetical protein ACE5PO_09530, partial [Candidatus Bathyarchaeia archaeon]
MVSPGAKGFEFESLVLDLFERLDYRIRAVNRRVECAQQQHRKKGLHELDLIVEHEMNRLMRPAFSPEGVSAVECKTFPLNNPVIVQDLREAIECANAVEEHDHIVGGVIVSGKDIGEEVAKESAKTGSIFCWDLNRLCFYAAKVYTLAELEVWTRGEAEARVVCEGVIDPSGNEFEVSRLVGISPNLAEEKHILRFIYFCDCLKNRLERSSYSFTSALLDDIRRDFLSTTEAMTQGGSTYPIAAEIEIHSLSHYQRDVERHGKIQVERWPQDADHPKASIEDVVFYEYDLAPWHALLRFCTFAPTKLVPCDSVSSLLVKLQAQALQRAAETVRTREDEEYLQIVEKRFKHKPPYVRKLTWWSDVERDVSPMGHHLDLYVHYRPRQPFFKPTLVFVTCNRERGPVTRDHLIQTMGYAG